MSRSEIYNDKLAFSKKLGFLRISYAIVKLGKKEFERQFENSRK